MAQWDPTNTPGETMRAPDNESPEICRLLGIPQSPFAVPGDKRTLPAWVLLPGEKLSDDSVWLVLRRDAQDGRLVASIVLTDPGAIPQYPVRNDLYKVVCSVSLAQARRLLNEVGKAALEDAAGVPMREDLPASEHGFLLASGRWLRARATGAGAAFAWALKAVRKRNAILAYVDVRGLRAVVDMLAGFASAERVPYAIDDMRADDSDIEHEARQVLLLHPGLSVDDAIRADTDAFCRFLDSVRSGKVSLSKTRMAAFGMGDGVPDDAVARAELVTGDEELRQAMNALLAKHAHGTDGQAA